MSTAQYSILIEQTMTTKMTTKSTTTLTMTMTMTTTTTTTATMTMTMTIDHDHNHDQKVQIVMSGQFRDIAMFYYSNQ